MTKHSALIVEDDPQLGKIFSLALQSDFDAEICTDGLAAITRLDQVTADIVVLDLHLPGASGQQVLEHIRASQRLAKTRVILATADHNQADLLKDEAEIVLLKPVSPIQLRELAIRLCQSSG